MTAIARPVFVDPGGGRTRRLRRGGLVVGALALAYVVLMGLGVVGSPSSPFGVGLFETHHGPTAAVTVRETSGAVLPFSVVPGASTWGRPARAFTPAAATVSAAASDPTTAGGSARSDRRAGSGNATDPQTMSSPGQSDTAPGQAKASDGTSTPPGQSGTAPGQAKNSRSQGPASGNGNANGTGNGKSNRHAYGSGGGNGNGPTHPPRP